MVMCEGLKRRECELRRAGISRAAGMAGRIKQRVWKLLRGVVNRSPQLARRCRPYYNWV